MIRSVRSMLRRGRSSEKKVRVYALVGETGTGKSFRARLIMERSQIDLLIDDGLLIRDQRILAGRSAKREKNRVSAVKRAIFQNPDHVEDVKQALWKEKFRSILIIGTSEKMVARIAEKLGLPYPDEIIYIEDVATREEITTARDSRQKEGKHVIPVPVIEVRKDPSQKVIDSLKFFLKTHPYLFWRKQFVEKTIVQPPFSRRGRLSISEAALSQMIMHCVSEFSQKLSIRKIVIDKSHTHAGYEIEVKLCVDPDFPIAEKLADLQAYVIRNIERFSGIQIEELDLTVEAVKGWDAECKPGHDRREKRPAKKRNTPTRKRSANAHKKRKS